MQFLAQSLSKSTRPLLISRARQSWVLSQQCHSTLSAKKSSSRTRTTESVSPVNSPEWPKPTEIPYQPKIANSTDLIGYVNQPIEFHAKPDGSFWAGTVITHGPPSGSGSDSDSDSVHKFWIPVIFEGDLAQTANCHLKKNDRVHVTGQIFVDASEIAGAKPDQAYVHIMVRDLHYIKGSKTLNPKVLPPLDQKESVLKHSASLLKNRDSQTDVWFDLVGKPDEWCDYRESKQNGSVNPRHPDFKKKDGTEALWLNKAPSEILSDLKDLKFDVPVRSKYAKQPKAGEESWKDLVENMNKWWDNRLNKRNEKAPDFKHKDTGLGLWLNDSPSWVIERLPPPRSKTSVSY